MHIDTQLADTGQDVCPLAFQSHQVRTAPIQSSETSYGTGTSPNPSQQWGTKFSRHDGAAYSCALSPLRVQDVHATAPRHAKVLFYVDQ